MIVCEIGIQNLVTRNAYIGPFTFAYTINIKRLATFWTSLLGVASEASDERIFVLSVIAAYVDRFSKVADLTECKNTLESWYFDMDSQTLYINYGLEYNPLYTPIEYLRSFGFCDTSAVYVDDIAFLPVITSSPSIKQKQDLIGYDKLAFNTGSFSFANEAGILDFMRTMSLFNNDVALYYLKYDGRSEYTREELTPLAWFLLEDVEISKRDGKIKLMDIRKAWNKKLPMRVINTTDYPQADGDVIGKAVPLLFGADTVDTLCTNATVLTGDVTYRAAEELTAITRVDLYKGDALTVPDANVYNVNLATGEFSIGNRDTDGKPFKARVICTGYADNSVLGVIKKVEELANSIAYTDSFFDTTEIEAELSGLEPVNIYLKQQTELYEIIRQLQEGSSNRFRYEVNAEGKRTARIDDLERTPAAFVPKEEILENESMALYTDKATIAASVKINYAKSPLTDSYRSVIDESQEAAVARNTREAPQIEFNTFLQDETTALARATLESGRLGQVRRFTDCTLRGEKFLGLRIYDIITIELIDESRTWAGTWNCQVLAVAPDTVKEQNKVTLVLIEQVADIDDGKILRITDTGAIRKTTTSDDIVRVTNGR